MHPETAVTRYRFDALSLLVLALSAAFAACGGSLPSSSPPPPSDAPAPAPDTFAAEPRPAEPLESGVIASRGGRVRVVQFADGSWEMRVEGEPFFIKGVNYLPVKVGECPGEGTMRDWMTYDDDRDGRNDVAFQTWVDANRNNRRDAGETEVGDFRLLQEMGVNTIRLYHLPSARPELGDIYRVNPSMALQFDHESNKDLLRTLFKDYGIRVVMGHFFGAYNIGSGLPWAEETDYANPVHRERILRSIRAMVLDHKDEPYVLFWMLGNENNFATWARINVPANPHAYASLLGEAAKLIHELDPEHPVASSEGDDFGWGDNAFTALRLYPELAPEIDIVSYNTYRGKDGPGTLWADVKGIFDRPVFISECGMFAYQKNTGENEEIQWEQDRGYWRDIVRHSAERRRAGDGEIGNAIGVTFFNWVDLWYQDEQPRVHNPGIGPWVASPDGIQHEEWFGILSRGDGREPLMRVKRKVYGYFRDVWSRAELTY